MQAAPGINFKAAAIITFVTLVTLAIALIFGLAAAFFPPLYIFILLAFLAFAVFAWKLPEYSALILMAGLAGIFPPEIVGHTATLIDISALILIVLIKYARKHQQWRPSIRPLVWPFFFLILLVAVGTARALLYQSTPHNAVFNEIMPFLYWLLFPIIAISLDSPKRLKYFIVVVFIMAVYIALGQIIQALFQVQLFFGGRFEIAETLGRQYSGVARSVTPGSFLLLFGLLTSVSFYIVKTQRILLLPLIALIVVFVLGLVFTFGRTLMGTALLVMLLMGFTLGAARVYKLVGVIALVGALAIGGLAIVKPNIYYALADRVLSIGSEVKSGDSLNYRRIENQVALKHIENSPLFGIGLGHDYRQGAVQKDVDVGARYIHNGYLYILLKLGLFTFLAYVSFYTAALIYARKTIQLVHSPYDKGVAAAIFALMLMPIITSLTRPEWMSPASTAMFAICVAILAAFRRHKAVNVSAIPTLHPAP